MTNEEETVLQDLDFLIEQGRKTNEIDICRVCLELDNKTIHHSLRSLYKQGVLDYDDNGDYFRR